MMGFLEEEKFVWGKTHKNGIGNWDFQFKTESNSFSQKNKNGTDSDTWKTVVRFWTFGGGRKWGRWFVNMMMRWRKFFILRR